MVDKVLVGRELCNCIRKLKQCFESGHVFFVLGTPPGRSSSPGQSVIVVPCVGFCGCDEGA